MLAFKHVSKKVFDQYQITFKDMFNLLMAMQVHAARVTGPSSEYVRKEVDYYPVRNMSSQAKSHTKKGNESWA